MVSKQKSHFNENMKKYSPDEALNGLLSTTRINFKRKNEYTGYLQNHYGNRGTQLLIRAKLNISQPGDKCEREADEIATKVMSMPAPIKGKTKENQLPIIQPKHRIDGNTTGNVAVDPETESKIKSSLGNGSPLQTDIKQDMEGRFRTDFSDVKIHNNNNAFHLNESLESQAFTFGQDIYFSKSIGNLKNHAEKKLICHELAHFLQQKESNDKIQRKKKKGSKRKIKDIEERIQNLELDNKKTKFLAALNSLRIDIMSMREFWEQVGRDLGSAYSNAYNFHKLALENRSRQKALEDAILWGILTTITAGALGWMGEVKNVGEAFKNIVKKEKLQKAIAGSIEDAAQAFLSESFDIIPTLSPKSTLISKSPLNFQNDFFNMIHENWKICENYVKFKSDCIEKYPLFMFENFNYRLFTENINNWLSDKKNMRYPKSPGRIILERELETRMWAKWAPSLKRREMKYTPSSDITGDVFRDVYDSPKTDVENRLKMLMPIKNWPSDIEWGSFWTSDKDIIKFINWGINYELKPFEF